MSQNQYTLRQVFDSTDCLSQEVLLAYLDGKLNEPDTRLVEMHIADCPLCDAALEGAMECGTEDFKALANELQGELKEKVSSLSEQEEDDKVIEFKPRQQEESAAPAASQKASGRGNWIRIISVAASVILIVGFTFFLMRPTAPKLADRYFDELDLGGTRSFTVDEQANFDKAVQLYDAKEYAQAAPLFDSVDSVIGKLCAANSYYHEDKYPEAEARYLQIIQNGNIWVRHAEYNLAVTYLKMGRMEEAKGLLQKMADNEEHDFQKKATELLKEVEAL